MTAEERASRIMALSPPLFSWPESRGLIAAAIVAAEHAAALAERERIKQMLIAEGARIKREEKFDWERGDQLEEFADQL